MNVLYDLAVIGAGAAGLMAALTAAREGLRVLLLDSKPKFGAKILMSGGTRCNVTNETVTAQDFESENNRALKHVLDAFPPVRTVQFFEDLGVKLVKEPGGKLFPSTHSGRTILEALAQANFTACGKIHSGRKVTALSFKGNGFEIQGSAFSFFAKTVLLTTGGLSYPASGSDGTGFKIAQSFGHTLVPTTPSLVPLTTQDPGWKSLSGVALPVRIKLVTENKTKAEFEGPLLFTHFGFSGPVVLNVSRHWIREKGRDKKMIVNFLPQENQTGFRERLLQAVQMQPKKRLKTFLAETLPERFLECFLAKIGIDATVVLGALKRESREVLLKLLLSYPLEVSGALGYEKAEVTAGGVRLDEVDSRTLESKLQPGLFLAGEILDVDGRIGGFNFQWAWASGYVAGKGAARKINSPH